MGVDRRTVLIMGGAAVLGTAAGGLGIGAVMRDIPKPESRPSPAERVSYESWRQRRKAPYFIGHRGAGDVAPEHTLPSYQAALDWGAAAIEISVVRSADNEVFCLHDLTLDRTTTAFGPARKQSAESLDKVRVTVPRLGPRWLGANRPVVSRFADVLRAVGGRAVLCLEAKDDTAYSLMTTMVEESGLQDTAMIKLSGTATARLKIAKKAGYPIYAYLGNLQVATARAIDNLGKVLDPRRDAVVLPARSEGDLFPSALISRAVDTGVPVWVVPVHRRYEVEHFTQLGVQGIVTPDLGYLTAAQPPLTADVWADGAISPGELTLEPYSEKYGLHWPEEGAIGLDVPDRPAFVSLGQFCPITARSYRIVFDAAFDPMPTDPWYHLSVAFGHADDRYYAHRSATCDGYHAQLRADGRMALYAHLQRSPNGQPLTATLKGRSFRKGVWSRLILDVTPTTISMTRDDGTFVQAEDDRFRGGYLHIGRFGPDGMLKIRNLKIY